MRFLSNLLRITLGFGFLSLPVHASEILLNRSDLVQIQSMFWAATGLELPRPASDVPVIGPRNTQDGVRLFRVLSGQGDVNGFEGVLYDNRDRGHSLLDSELYPSLTFLKYGPALISEGYDFGLAGRIFLPGVVFGNSSAAMTGGPAPRSLPRLAMTTDFWRVVTPKLYVNNHIYVYPEHRDHDAEDRFPVNWPYMIISQGSSRSDRRFLNAIALTLAALPRDTFDFLEKNGLVAPTLQMVLRRNLEPVSSRAEYLSGAAHPVVFDGKLVRTGRMVAQAAELRPADIPPLVQLRVVSEDFSKFAGLAEMDERFLDTPSSIGRLWRGFAWDREMEITAEDTSAPNNRPLTFEWRLLRGDPERVWIEPQAPDGRTARIRVAWHDPWTEPIPGSDDSERRVSRVDIGVFANNGVHDSAPAIISIDFPRHQTRRYSAGPDGEHRLVSIDYTAKERGIYLDPLLYWSAPWTDTARYDASGALLGWDRKDANESTSRFVAEKGDTPGPRYEIDLASPRVPVLREVSEGLP